MIGSTGVGVEQQLQHHRRRHYHRQKQQQDPKRCVRIKILGSRPQLSFVLLLLT